MQLEHLVPDGVVSAAPYTPVVVAGDIVATSGQAPFGADGRLIEGDFRAQAVQVFENLGACLAAAGCTFADVFKVNGYLSSFDHFAAYNELYATYFSPPLPARTTVQVGLFGFDVEVEAWALRRR